MIAAGALRLEVMDLKDLLRALPGGREALARYLQERDEPIDHTLVATCEHGRALTATCRRCTGKEAL